MGIGKRLVVALSTGDQTQSSHHETRYDVLRASAYSRALGLAIKRLRADGDPKPGNINNVVLMLHATVYERDRASRTLLDYDRGRLCRLAVLERFCPQCQDCHGVGQAWEHPDGRVGEKGTLLAVCKKCYGSGVRYWRDQDRNQFFGRRLSGEEETVLTRALTYLVDFESMAEATTHRALEQGFPEEYMVV